MPVSGIVIRTRPDQQQRVAGDLAAMPGVELQPAASDAVLVAVLDTGDFDQEQALVNRISALEGVSGVNLAYHNFEDMVEVQDRHRPIAQ